MEDRLSFLECRLSLLDDKFEDKISSVQDRLSSFEDKIDLLINLSLRKDTAGVQVIQYYIVIYNYLFKNFHVFNFNNKLFFLGSR